MSSEPASRASSLLPPQGDDPLAPAAGSKAACAQCGYPIIERMPLSRREPPMTPAAAAAAVPRKEPPGAIGAPVGPAGIACGGCDGCGVPVFQAGDMPS